MFCKTICKESCHAGFKQKSETLGICSNHHVGCLYPGRSLSFQTISELFQHILKSMATPIRQESTGNLYQYIQTPRFPKEAKPNSHLMSIQLSFSTWCSKNSTPLPTQFYDVSFTLNSVLFWFNANNLWLLLDMWMFLLSYYRLNSLNQCCFLMYLISVHRPLLIQIYFVFPIQKGTNSGVANTSRPYLIFSAFPTAKQPLVKEFNQIEGGKLVWLNSMAEFFPVERYQKWAGKSASYIDHTNRETMHLHVWIPILSTNLIDRLCFGQVKHSVWQENLVWRFMVMGGLNHIWWHNCV